MIIYRKLTGLGDNDVTSGGYYGADRARGAWNSEVTTMISPKESPASSASAGERKVLGCL